MSGIISSFTVSKGIAPFIDVCGKTLNLPYIIPKNYYVCITANIKNVGNSTEEYKLQLISPQGNIVDNEPDTYWLNISPNQTKSITVSGILNSEGLYDFSIRLKRCLCTSWTGCLFSCTSEPVDDIKNITVTTDTATTPSLPSTIYYECINGICKESYSVTPYTSLQACQNACSVTTSPPTQCQSILNKTITSDKTTINVGESIKFKVKIRNTTSKNCNIYNNDSYIPYNDTKLTSSPFILDADGCGETNVIFGTAGTYNIYAATDYSMESTNIIQIIVTKDGIQVKCSKPQLHINGKQGIIIIESTPATIELTHCGEANDDYVITRTDLTPDVDIASGTTNSDGIAKTTYNIPVDGVYEFVSGEDCIVGGLITICNKIGNTVTVRAGKISTSGTGLCGKMGVSDQDCTYIKYGSLAFGGLIILKILTDLIPKSK